MDFNLDENINIHRERLEQMIESEDSKMIKKIIKKIISKIRNGKKNVGV